MLATTVQPEEEVARPSLDTRENDPLETLRAVVAFDCRRQSYGVKHQASKGPPASGNGR